MDAVFRGALVSLILLPLAHGAVAPTLHPSPSLRCIAPACCAAPSSPMPDGNEALFSAIVDLSAAAGGGNGNQPVNLLRELSSENAQLKERIKNLESTIANTEGLCEVLDDGGGWTSSLGTRASWLLGLLVCQSASSFILADNEALLVSHPTVIFFMTMLVGAGGNAGNQAAVRIIRGLATGEVDPSPTDRTRQIVSDEIARALALAVILVVAGFVRVVAFQSPVADAVAISAALFIIVSTSVVLGTILPLLLQAAKVDAAHASTSIQVVMDVFGLGFYI